MKRLACVFLSLSLGCLLIGCKGKAPQGPPQAKVSGTVTLDGKAMTGGQIRFYAVGIPARVFEIKDGAFSGEVATGKNRVEILWEKDGKPNPMDPSLPPLKVNVVDAKFSGGKSPFNPEIPASGQSDLKFAVTSATGN